MANQEKYNSIFTGEEIDEAVGHVQEMTQKYKHVVTLSHKYHEQPDYIFEIVCDHMAPIDNEDELAMLFHGCDSKHLYEIDPVDNSENEYPLFTLTYVSLGVTNFIGMYKMAYGGTFSQINVIGDPNYTFVGDEVEEV